MSRGVRGALGAIALVLFVCIVVLMFRGPRFATDGYGEPVVKVRCGSILTVGWPSDHSYISSDEGSSVWGDHIQTGPGSLPSGAREGIARDCSERRDTYLAFALLLSMATTVLGALAVVGRRAEPPAVDQSSAVPSP